MIYSPQGLLNDCMLCRLQADHHSYSTTSSLSTVNLRSSMCLAEGLLMGRSLQLSTLGFTVTASLPVNGKTCSRLSTSQTYEFADIQSDQTQRHHRRYPFDLVTQFPHDHVNALTHCQVIPCFSSLPASRYSSSLANGKTSTWRIYGFMTPKMARQARFGPISRLPVGQTRASPNDPS